MILQPIFYGVRRALRSKKIVLWLYSINLSFSLFLVTPIYHTIKPLITKTQYSDLFLRDFPMEFLIDFNFNYPKFFPLYKNILIISGIAFIFFHVFLSGGILKTILREEERYNLKTFFEGCYDYFWRFFKVFLISIPFYAFSFLLIRRWIFDLILKNYKFNEKQTFFFRIGMDILLLLTVFFLNFLFDLTKIKVVYNNSKSILLELFDTSIFIVKNLLSSFYLYFTLGLINAIFIIVYNLLSPISNASTSLSILFAFSIMQVLVILRVFLKLTFWSSEFEFYLGVLSGKKSNKIFI